MFVKICGTTNLEDAQLAVSLGADALGFIFAPSRRCVTADGAAQITRQLAPHILRVGVFTQPAIGEIVHTVETAGLSAVQMHWPYQSGCIEKLRTALGADILLWQVVGYGVDPEAPDSEDMCFRDAFRTAMLDTRLDAVLLDSVRGGKSGGLGQAFSWQQARGAVQAVRREAEQAHPRGPCLVIAGGLHVDNVAEAVQALQPWGVDVVTGVEAGPGRKSPDRLSTFLATAKAL